jgi:hypothetical protein
MHKYNIVDENIWTRRRSKRLLNAEKIRDLLRSCYANEPWSVRMGWAYCS